MQQYLKPNILNESPNDRLEIYRIRHSVYGEELGQHNLNREGVLHDDLDDFNHYIVAKDEEEIRGFVSITPPDRNRYSVDKYFPRNQISISFDESVYEVRLLTVRPSSRGRILFLALMFAAYRWVQERGGKHIVAIGRKEVRELYKTSGFNLSGLKTSSGQVSYELMTMNVGEQLEHLRSMSHIVNGIKKKVNWQLKIPFWDEPEPVTKCSSEPSVTSNCFHGGHFFGAIGERFEDLSRRENVLNADVLDAWFSPAPKVIKRLREHLPWLLRTSPPTHSEGLLETISLIRNIPEPNLMVGAGSSSLIYQVFQQIFSRKSKVLLPDPTYGEYSHVLHHVTESCVDLWPLDSKENFVINPQECIDKIRREHHDGLVLVNPNNPTGQWLCRDDLHFILNNIPRTTMVWVDEAYLDYVEGSDSVERDTTRFSNLIVCKSLSKAYAMSGARAAYVSAHPQNIKKWNRYTPPWAIGLPTQLAAVDALNASAYYQIKYRETNRLRKIMIERVRANLPDWKVYPAVANFILCELPSSGPSAQQVISLAASENVFLRDAGKTSQTLGDGFIRIAIKPENDQERIIETLLSCLKM
jgi:histidinol-phosphate/aromatic aminotransferase/cobyric acid decarboxylase-like protein/N-acyl-L-homoserine lactone synthetase